MSRWMPDTPGIRLSRVAARVPFQILPGLAGQKRKKTGLCQPGFPASSNI